MTTKDDGGPAFPNITPDMPIQGGPGMSIRDWFAGMAMQGIISCPGDLDGYYEEDVVATNAYKMADAMLRERAK